VFQPPRGQGVTRTFPETPFPADRFRLLVVGSGRNGREPRDAAQEPAW